MKHRPLIMMLSMTLASLGTLHAQDKSPLRALPVIQMSNNLGHFDHMSADAGGKRLFISDEDSNTLEVVDLGTGQSIQTIAGWSAAGLALPSNASTGSSDSRVVKVPHNSLFLPDRNLIIVNDGGGYCRFVNGFNYKLIRAIKLQLNCDFIVFDPKTKYVYVTNGGHAIKGMDHGYLSIINTLNAEHLGDILLPAAHIEAVTIEKAGSRIFVDASDHNSVLVIDKGQKKVVDEWKIPDAGMNIAMALDEKNKRLFVGCWKPARVVVFDTDSGKAVASVPTAELTDDMSFDAARNRIYVSGEGYVSIIQEKDPDHYSEIGQIPTGKNSHTSTFIPELSLFVVASKPIEGRAPELQPFQAQ